MLGGWPADWLRSRPVFLFIMSDDYKLSDWVEVFFYIRTSSIVFSSLLLSHYAKENGMIGILELNKSGSVLLHAGGKCKAG